MVMSRAEKARRATAAATAASKPDAAVEPAATSTGPKIKPSDRDNPLGPKIQSPATHERKASVGDRTVVVVCKMPRGLFLQLSETITQDQRVVGGGIEKRQVSMRVGPQIRLKPSVLPFGTVPNYLIVEGFSINPNIDANFWNEYYGQNKNLQMITSGLLCAFNNEPDAVAYCKEYGKLKHGLEPIAQKDDPRVDREQNPNLTDIDIDTDTPRPKG